MREPLYRQPVAFHLVIPCLEESPRLPSYLKDLVLLLRTKEYRTSILVVDDGSSQQEQESLRAVIAELNRACNAAVDSLYLERNMGKGYAVRQGWSAGKSAQWLAFADADGATPAYEVVRIFDIIDRNNEEGRCYFGSRIRMLGRSVQRRWKRHIFGRMYATLVGIVIDDSIYDSQCGFKVIPGKAFALISGLLRENRFAFDIELIAALSEAGYPLEEVPIDWTDVPGSKVSLIKDSARMLASLFLIHRRKKRGCYRTAGVTAGSSASRTASCAMPRRRM
jgi:dolichyl-phosphate beta-glucosyltransferase